MEDSKKNEKILSLLFLRKDDQILLAMKKRGFGEGRWNGVGGKIEPGETVEQAMLRETQEEISVAPTSYHQVANITFDEYFKDKKTLIRVHVYFADKWDGEPTESEEMAPKWFNLDEIPYSSMWPDDPYWLPEVIKGKLIQAHFKLDKTDTIISHTVEKVDEIQ